MTTRAIARGTDALRAHAYAHPLTRARGFLPGHFIHLEGGVKVALSVNK